MPFDYPDVFPKSSINAVELAHMEATREFETATRRQRGLIAGEHLLNSVAKTFFAFLLETVPLVKSGQWDLAQARAQAREFPTSDECG